MIYTNEGDIYYINNVSDLFILRTLYKYCSGVKWYKSLKRTYANLPISFDIEATSYSKVIKDEIIPQKYAWMYEWTFGINGLVFYGRRWNEFHRLLNIIRRVLKLDSERYIIVYVHNLAYEFQFMRKLFNWDNIFAIEERKPLYARTIDGIEFKCSYQLSGYSLDTVGKNLKKYKIQKLKGDLNYDLLRTADTPLSDKELSYCINDVKVVMSYIQEQIEEYGAITKIPLTKTGKVRKFVREKCFHNGCENKEEKTKKMLSYKNLIKTLKMDENLYLMCKSAFQGGFTHASCVNSGVLFKDVYSYDMTSAYPSVMVSERFPMTTPVEVFDYDNFKWYLNNKHCIFSIRLYDVKPLIQCEHYIASYKCNKLVNAVEDNGRIVSADYLEIALTEVDFNIILYTYNFKYELIKLYVCEKDYLPKEIILSVLELYANKTTLKGVEGKEKEYTNSKENLNSCYGMCVTDIARDNIVYQNNEWQTEAIDFEECFTKYNNDTARFLYYLWGIYITAYNRYNLWKGILELGYDEVYCDTDSLKFLNLEDHLEWFNSYNDTMIKKIENCLDYYGIEHALAFPKTIKGVVKPLGVFDYEGKYEYFKTLGAKRYAYVKDGEFSLVVSGLNKTVCVPYLIEKYGTFENIFNEFKDGLYIPRGKTGKQIHTYIDNEIDLVVTDYMGNVTRVQEKSGIHLEASDYTLDIDEDYLDYLLIVHGVIYPQSNVKE